MKKSLIFLDTSRAQKFCDNRCVNKECNKHISKLYKCNSIAHISKLRYTPECEGYVSKWKQSHAEIEQIKNEMRKNGIDD